MSEQVLITGISGFTTEHIALNLQLKGYDVRGILRTPKRAEQIRQTLEVAGNQEARLLTRVTQKSGFSLGVMRAVEGNREARLLTPGSSPELASSWAWSRCNCSSNLRTLSFRSSTCFLRAEPSLLSWSLKAPTIVSK